VLIVFIVFLIQYHEGFRNQVQQWPENPVKIFIDYLKAHPKSVVGDFGCGEAEIARTVSNKVYSFDLQAANEYVTVCDIAKVRKLFFMFPFNILSFSHFGNQLGSFGR
jgi:hypothetical protein